MSGAALATPGDPLEKINAKSYEVVQSVDRGFVRPVSVAYRDVLPGPVRSGLRNILKNIDQPAIFVNFVLQLKPASALRALGRFAINSTIGLGGLLDVAKSPAIGLPYRPNGFANTMGYYGIKPGPYMFLPLVGPTTLRDLIGLGLDRGFLPAVVGKPLNRPVVATGIAVVRTLDYRVEFDEQLQRLNNDADDPYGATRSFYLAQRQAEIDALRGRSPAAKPATPDK